jgi:hypothetical protein
METKLYPDAKHIDSLQVGAEFLDFVVIVLHRFGLYLQPFTSKKYQYNKGESFQGWEIKLDNRFTDTGRLSIEIAEKTSAGQSSWTPSGIYRNDNTWLYIQGNYEYFYIFAKSILKLLHARKKLNGEKFYIEEEMPTIKKFYLPLKDAEKYCVYKVVPLPIDRMTLS